MRRALPRPNAKPRVGARAERTRHRRGEPETRPASQAARSYPRQPGQSRQRQNGRVATVPSSPTVRHLREGSRRGGTRIPSWLIPAIALMAVIVLLAARHHRAATATRPALSPSPLSAASLTPILLPPPGGNAPRVRPVDLVLLLDPADKQDPAIQPEVTAALNYIGKWSMPGDTVGAGTASNPLLPAASASPATLVAALQQPEAGSSTQEVSQALRRLVNPTHDHTLVVISSTPELWLANLPSAPAPDPAVPPSKRPTQLRTYVIDTSPGGGQRPAAPATPQGQTPIGLAADAGTRGAIAEATGMAWVDAIGAVWAGGS